MPPFAPSYRREVVPLSVVTDTRMSSSPPGPAKKSITPPSWRRGYAGRARSGRVEGRCSVAWRRSCPPRRGCVAAAGVDPAGEGCGRTSMPSCSSCHWARWPVGYGGAARRKRSRPPVRGAHFHDFDPNPGFAPPRTKLGAATAGPAAMPGFAASGGCLPRAGSLPCGASTNTCTNTVHAVSSG